MLRKLMTSQSFHDAAVAWFRKQQFGEVKPSTIGIVPPHAEDKIALANIRQVRSYGRLHGQCVTRFYCHNNIERLEVRQ